MPSEYPHKIYVELTTRCNLHCAMCVKFAGGNCIEEGDLPLESFKRMTPALARTRLLVLNGIGEPLLHPHLESVITLARTAMPATGKIGFQSNGRLLSQEMAHRLVGAGLNTICLSLDQFSPTAAPHSDQGHSFTPVARAVAHLNTAAQAAPEHFRTGLEIVISKDNLSHLPALVTWAAEQGIAYLIVSHLFPYDGSMRDQSLFHPNPSEAVEVFTKWNEEAVARGVHLRDLSAAQLKYTKSPADRLLVDIGTAMQREAREKDIPMHLPSLLQHDHETIAKTRQIFAQAAAVAETHGMELSLPPLYARGGTRRRCPFIEDEAVFIAQNGDIMPCHFLWHNYCYIMNQSSVQVRKLVFGNLNHQTLTSAWQGERNLRFRTEVRRREYTACWSCTSGPCADLVNTNLLTVNDCYGSSVPCGHCMWSIGWVACL